MYMLSSITFVYNLFNEIFINVKLIILLILKKHSKYKCYYPIGAIAYITTLSYVYTIRDKDSASRKQLFKTLRHNENIEHILNLHISLFII